MDFQSTVPLDLPQADGVSRCGLPTGPLPGMARSGIRWQGFVTEPGGLLIRWLTLGWILIRANGLTWEGRLCGISSTSQVWTGRPSCISACGAPMRGERSGQSLSTPIFHRLPEVVSDFSTSFRNFDTPRNFPVLARGQRHDKAPATWQS